jgi:hypothetical protein
MPQILGDIAYDDHFNGIAEATEEGERMAAAMGDKRILFLANYGVVVVGATVAQALDDFYYLERACQVQILAMQSGQPLKVMPDAMARETHEQFTRFSVNADLLLEDIKATLDAEEPVYHPDFKAMPYWWEAYMPTAQDPLDVPPRVRVAIVGGGYAGLSTALEAANTAWIASFSKRPNLASVPARATVAASAAA